MTQFRCQFHQYFTSSFFIWKCFETAFLYLGLRFVYFCQKKIGAKAAGKMLMKLTQVLRRGALDRGVYFLAACSSISPSLHPKPSEDIRRPWAKLKRWANKCEFDLATFNNFLGNWMVLSKNTNNGKIINLVPFKVVESTIFRRNKEYKGP